MRDRFADGFVIGLGVAIVTLMLALVLATPAHATVIRPGGLSKGNGITASPWGQCRHDAPWGAGRGHCHITVTR